MLASQFKNSERQKYRRMMGESADSILIFAKKQKNGKQKRAAQEKRLF
jgi:hypothetical protein